MDHTATAARPGELHVIETETVPEPAHHPAATHAEIAGIVRNDRDDIRGEFGYAPNRTRCRGAVAQTTHRPQEEPAAREPRARLKRHNRRIGRVPAAPGARCAANCSACQRRHAIETTPKSGEERLDDARRHEVDWRAERLRIAQRKTRGSLWLPLTDEVETAPLQPTPARASTDPRARYGGKLLISGERTQSRGIVTGIALLPPGAQLLAHHHEPEETYYVVSGQGEMEIDDETTAVGPGCAIYIPAHARHALRCTGSEPLLFVFSFARDSFDQITYHFVQ